MAVRGVDRVVVATDDARIADHAAGFGAEVVMTSSDCQNGTERCAEVAAKLPGFDDCGESAGRCAADASVVC